MLQSPSDTILVPSANSATSEDPHEAAFRLPEDARPRRRRHRPRKNPGSTHQILCRVTHLRHTAVIGGILGDVDFRRLAEPSGSANSRPSTAPIRPLIFEGRHYSPGKSQGKVPDEKPRRFPSECGQVLMRGPWGAALGMPSSPQKECRSQ